MLESLNMCSVAFSGKRINFQILCDVILAMTRTVHSQVVVVTSPFQQGSRKCCLFLVVVVFQRNETLNCREFFVWFRSVVRKKKCPLRLIKKTSPSTTAGEHRLNCHLDHKLKCLFGVIRASLFAVSTNTLLEPGHLTSEIRGGRESRDNNGLGCVHLKQSMVLVGLECHSRAGCGFQLEALKTRCGGIL